ncbi:MAG: AAA family ATPase, partial [Propionicimonas sp.]|nr:AAA family ATPase [Propionicimonas sp.]
TAGGRGRILALAGAKGGVGVSVLAALLATRAAGEGQTVCLVDLDLRAGDLAFLCGVSPRRSVADLAGLAGDLTIRGIREVVVDVPAGFALLAAPDRVEQSEEVTAQAVRQILHELRRNFSLVVVDTGSVLDDPRAVALEVADEVLLVANCELISIRAARRSLEAWERLGVRTTDRARLVVNQSSKQREIQPDLVARLVKLPLLTAVASAPAEFEGPVNTGTLTGERPATGMQAAGAILAGCGTDAPALRQATSAGRGPASRRKRSRAGSRVLVEESGSSAVELPVFVLLFMITFFICIQGLVLGLGYIVAGNAANEAAREASVGRSLAEIDQVSQHAMLGLEFSANTRVDAGARVVTVDVGVPKVFGWLPDGLQAASARAAYLPEDDS